VRGLGVKVPNWSYERRMPMYSFSSRRRTSTFSVVYQHYPILIECVARTVNHVQQHRRGQEGLWW
jgi:hypothetical protein